MDDPNRLGSATDGPDPIAALEQAEAQDLAIGQEQAEADTQMAVVIDSPAAEQAEEPLVDEQVGRRVPERMTGVCLADGKVVDFDPGKLDLAIGETVVVHNDRDLNLGKVVYLVPNSHGRHLRRVLRRVGSHDLLLMRRNAKREEEACDFCERRIAERDLEMKLVRVAFLHGGNKAIFFFTADGRVDFRSLVRDLAQQLHVRIEMRQIGVRDEAKLLGGIGICGQPLCCTRYLRKFVPVSIKMAKNQGLALNPQKVSGLCSRLMCCLVYEDDTYRKLRKGFPRVGKAIETPAGSGKVIEADVLGRKVRVVTEQGLVTFTLEQLESGIMPPPSAGSPAARSRVRKREPAQAAPAQIPEPAPPVPAQAAEAQDPEGRSRLGRRRRRRRKPTPEAAAPAATQASAPTGPQAVGAALLAREPGQPGPRADRDEGASPSPSQRKKRSRRRSRRRRNRGKAGGPGEGGTGGDPAGGGGGGAQPSD